MRYHGSPYKAGLAGLAHYHTCVSKVIIIISLKLAKSYAVVAAKKNLRQAPPSQLPVYHY